MEINLRIKINHRKVRPTRTEIIEIGIIEITEIIVKYEQKQQL